MSLTEAGLVDLTKDKGRKYSPASGKRASPRDRRLMRLKVPPQR